MKEERFSVNMSKQEMIRFYANKIVEDGIRDCNEFSNIICLKDYEDGIELKKYKNDLLEILYRDERVADVFIDDELNLNMVFYTDYCPFYYDDEDKDLIYCKISDSPTYQSNILKDFTNYIQKRIYEESYISIRNLLEHFTEEKQGKNESKEKLYNFLKKSIIQTEFVDKYIDNISVYVTYKNHKELEDALLEIAKQKEKSEEIETEFE